MGNRPCLVASCPAGCQRPRRGGDHADGWRGHTMSARGQAGPRRLSAAPCRVAQARGCINAGGGVASAAARMTFCQVGRGALHVAYTPAQPTAEPADNQFVQPPVHPAMAADLKRRQGLDGRAGAWCEISWGGAGDELPGRRRDQARTICVSFSRGALCCTTSWGRVLPATDAWRWQLRWCKNDSCQRPWLLR